MYVLRRGCERVHLNDEPRASRRIVLHANMRAVLRRGRGMVRRLAPAAVLAALSGLAGLALTATSVWLICRAVA